MSSATATKIIDNKITLDQTENSNNDVLKHNIAFTQYL